MDISVKRLEAEEWAGERTGIEEGIAKTFVVVVALTGVHPDVAQQIVAGVWAGLGSKEPAPTTHDTDTAALRHAIRLAVHRARVAQPDIDVPLTHLPSQPGLAIVLHAMGMSRDEIAEVIGVGKVAVAELLKRAVDALITKRR